MSIDQSLPSGQGVDVDGLTAPAPMQSSVKPGMLRGIIPALVTPRKAGVDEVDTDRLHTLVERLVVDDGVHGIFPASSTGEAPSLTQAQRLRTVETTVATVNSRVPVLVGVGAPSTSASIAYAKDAALAGADYIVVLPNHFVALTQDELYGYFAEVADSVAIPTILYNYPARTSGQNIRPALAAKLAESHNVVGVKDSSGDLTNTIGYINECGPNFAVFTGSESLIYPCMTMGGAGSICAGANVFPKQIVRLYDAVMAGDNKKAQELQAALVPLRRWGSIGTFPAPVKAAMALLGEGVGGPFSPVQALAGPDWDAIKAVVEEINSPKK